MNEREMKLKKISDEKGICTMTKPLKDGIINWRMENDKIVGIAVSDEKGIRTSRVVGVYRFGAVRIAETLNSRYILI